MIPKGRKGVADEVFKIALAIIIVAAVLGIVATVLSEIKEDSVSAINATGSAFRNFTARIVNKTASF